MLRIRRSIRTAEGECGSDIAGRNLAPILRVTDEVAPFDQKVVRPGSLGAPFELAAIRKRYVFQCLPAIESASVSENLLEVDSEATHPQARGTTKAAGLAQPRSFDFLRGHQDASDS